MNITLCCRFLKQRSIRLRLIPDRHLSEAVMLIAPCIEANSTLRRRELRRHVKQLIDRSELPWWVKLLLQAALNVLIQLLLLYLGKDVR